MAKGNKTVPVKQDVGEYLASVDPKRHEDAAALVQMMTELSGSPAVMWGTSIVGFGTYHYVYDSGREGDAMRVGFSPRKGAISLYIMSGFDAYGELLGRLGKHKIGKSCLYIKRLSDVDEDVLRELISASLAWMEAKYPSA